MAIKVLTVENSVVIEDNKVRLEITTKRFIIRVIAKNGSYKYLECSCGDKLNSVEEVMYHLKVGHYIIHPVDTQEGIEKYLVRESKAGTKKAVCKICKTAFNFDVSAQSDYVCSDCAERDRPVYGGPVPPRSLPAVKGFRPRQVTPTGWYKWHQTGKTTKILVDI